MAITMNGKIANAGNLRMIDGLFRNQTAGYTALYMGFIEGGTPLDDTSTLAGIDEAEGLLNSGNRLDVTSAFGSAAALDSGVPTIKNSGAINTVNATVAENITGWFITNAQTGTTGLILAYGNVSSGSLNTNVGSPVTFDANAITITVD